MLIKVDLTKKSILQGAKCKDGEGGVIYILHDHTRLTHEFCLMYQTSNTYTTHHHYRTRILKPFNYGYTCELMVIGVIRVDNTEVELGFLPPTKRY